MVNQAMRARRAAKKAAKEIADVESALEECANKNMSVVYRLRDEKRQAERKAKEDAALKEKREQQVLMNETRATLIILRYIVLRKIRRNKDYMALPFQKRSSCERLALLVHFIDGPLLRPDFRVL